MKVVLHLTKSCNLRCRYCYAPAKIQKSMDVETGQRAIELLLRHSNGSACVSYFGGEPLLVWDKVQALTLFARQAGQRRNTEMHFRLSTNGTLFTEEQLAFCREHNILFAISLDGDRAAHDAQRVQADGRGSWQLIDEKLDLILRYNPHTVFTSVVTPQTAGRLLPSITYMWSRGIRFVVHQLDYTHPDWTQAHLEVLAESYRALAGFYLEQVRRGDHFHLGLFDDKLKTHARSPFKLGEICDFGARKFSVAPDGRIYPCVQFISDKPDAEDYCIGDVEHGFSPRRDQLIAANRGERQQCAGCALLGRCSNYCGCMNWQTTGRLTEVPGILCAHEQMLIPIADEVGNVLWQEREAHFLRKHYRDFDTRFLYRFD